MEILAFYKLLIEKGAEVNRRISRGIFGGTPLTWSIMSGHVMVSDLLIQAGADIQLTDFGGPYLHYAASTGNVEMCRILLDAGADVYERDGDGNTALFYAIENQHKSV